MKMRNAVSALPDKMLRLTQALPSPSNARTFYLLRGIFRALGHATNMLTRIRFGGVAITVPLEHPAVYWRYLPIGFNQNYLLVVEQVIQVRSGLIIDVGANIGDGVALIRGAGIDAPILAIEGADVWFNLLRSNTYDFPSVSLEQAFLGSGEWEGQFALQVQDGSSKLVSSDSGVDITSLDILLLRHKEYPVVLLKTDTDGFDAKVLFGARALLTEQRPVVFCEMDEGLLRAQGNSSQELLDYLSECGYSFVVVWDNYGQWLASRPMHQGFADLIARYPGGPDMPYLDLAVFSEADRNIFDLFRGGLQNGA